MVIAKLTRNAAVLLCAVFLSACWDSSGRLIPAHAQVQLPVRPGIYATTPQVGYLPAFMKLEPGPRAVSPLYSKWVGDQNAGWRDTLAQKAPDPNRNLLEIYPLEPGVFLIAEVRGVTSDNYTSPEAETNGRNYAIAIVRPDGFELLDASCVPRPGVGMGNDGDTCPSITFTSFDQLVRASREALAIARSSGMRGEYYRWVAPA